MQTNMNTKIEKIIKIKSESSFYFSRKVQCLNKIFQNDTEDKKAALVIILKYVIFKIQLIRIFWFLSKLRNHNTSHVPKNLVVIAVIRKKIK